MSKKQFEAFLDTPPLWTNEQFGIQQFVFPGVDLTDFEPLPIPPRLRLGHQMEEVFKQLLDASPQHDLILHNVAIKRQNRTIGEIDFIVRDIENKVTIHIELTYKFYIIDTNISEPIHQLVGPNRRDMFFTKMEKIKSRQFPLLHTAEGKDALGNRGIDDALVMHQCCFKGQLFVPYGTPSVHIRPLNKACIQGFWLKFDDFNTEEFRGYSYYIPNKSEWVVPPYDTVAWKNHFEILMDINLRMIKANAPMVWMRKSESEFEKFFVVWW